MSDTTAISLALQALRLCRSGQTAAGVGLYRTALATAGGVALPVGLHCLLLEQSGDSAGAAQIRRAGRIAGADLSSSPLQRGLDPHAAVREYQAVFAAGDVNTQMLANYMVCLSLAGATEALAEVSSPAVFLRQRQLQYFASDPTALARVSQTLLDSPLREHQPSVRSVRGMDRIPGTHTLDDPDLRAIHAEVVTHLDDYRKSVLAAGHWIARFLPGEFSVRSWAVISDGHGHNVPHFHPGCWLVAVLYIALDPPPRAGSGAGTLHIGPGVGGRDDSAGWPRARITPIPGKLVLFPAYYTHSTVPLDNAGLRVSLAFNASSRPNPADSDAVLRNAAPPM